ncbi:MAG: V-type ATPase subunit [Clostridia bacterium]|nr:V-type ATPase subunit [Clostridia bacterium]
MPKVTTNDYAFSSVRIRALEKTLVGKDELEQLLDAPGTDRTIQLLTEFGFGTEDGPGVPDRSMVSFEELLFQKTADAFREVAEILPEKDSVDMLRLKYDCHNVKSALKCSFLGVSYASMLIDLGTVPADSYPEMMKNGDFSALPKQMAEAAALAKSEFASSNNPQVVDLMLDRACFEDISVLSNRLGSDFLNRYMSVTADLINVETAIRLIRMGHSDGGRVLLKDALLPGGSLEAKLFSEAYDEGESFLTDKLQFGTYHMLGKQFADSDRAFSTLEKISDNYLTNMLKEVIFIPFGPEIGFAYLRGMETSVKNIRIVLTGKAAGLDRDQIKERMRDSYV